MAEPTNTTNLSRVERVARALCDADSLSGYPPWEILTPNEYEFYRLRARLAIGAMRLDGSGCWLEDAGINKLDEVMPGENDVQRSHFVAAFNAVIRAALAEDA